MILVLTLLAGLHADIKLRIYLDDGTLQAGNLVSETPEAFVILSKEGRIDVPKKRIMFINGKSLKQWQDKPDKLFQTEIIPSEIPHPAYVNDKANTPPAVPSLADLKSILPKSEEVKTTAAPASKPVNSPAVKAESSAAAASASAPASDSQKKSAPAEKVQPQKQEVISEKKTDVPAVMASAAKLEEKPSTETKTTSPETIQKQDVLAAATQNSDKDNISPSVENPVEKTVPRTRRRKKKPMETVKIEAPKPSVESVATIPEAVSAASSSESPVSSSISAIKKPERFRRKEFADYHFARAKELLSEKATGQAIQELHLATLLDRQNGESSELLGKLYYQEKIYSKAEKYLSHPVIKKNENVKKMLESIPLELKKEEKSRNILYASAAAGVFTAVPLIVLLKRMRRVKAVKPLESSTALDREPAADPVEESQEKFKEFDNSVSEVLADMIEKIAENKEINPAADVFQPVLKPIPEKVTAVDPPPVPPSIQEPAFLKILPPSPDVAKELDKPIPPLTTPVEPPAPMAPPKQVELPKPPSISVPMFTVSMTQPQPEPEPQKNVEPEKTPQRTYEEVVAAGKMGDEILQRGNQCCSEEKWDRAEREYRTVLALSPYRIEAYLGLGYVYFAQGKWQLSLEHYVKVLEMDPHSADAHYGVARVLLETNRIEEALPELQTTLRLDPTFDDARETLTALGKLV